jgi:histidinol-phosphate/aromatic aminotransferase/cobyric acid decarboxylase-like protein
MNSDALLLHRNEYYFPHSPRVRALLENPTPAGWVSTYATRDTLDAFIQELANALELPTEHITLYHGAEDALFKILSWAAGHRMTVYTTGLGWAEYMRMMQGLELNIMQTALASSALEYSHPQKQFEQALYQAESKSLVLLASPNNPTGHDPSVAELIRLAKLFPQHIFLVDRVYTEFSKETFGPLSTCSNVITLGSFSKYFGLPGLRVGFAIGPTPAVQSMALGPSPWALHICQAALLDRDFYAKHWDIMKNVAQTLQQMESSAGQFLKTSAPFVLFRCSKNVSEEDLKWAQQHSKIVGKIITTSPSLQIRWSLGSPEAFQRISSCIRNIEIRLTETQ